LNHMSPETAQAKAKELFLESRGQMPNKEIARIVGRDPAQVSRWKEKGGWNEELADHAIDGMVGLGDGEGEKVLDRINWNSPEPLDMAEVDDIMTVIYKGFLRQLLQKTLYGGITITNFYQADQFMARIEATIRRIQGDPDETIKHVHEIESIPGAEKDDDSIIESVKRMKALARNRRRRQLQAGEDNVDVQLIEEEIIEGEVVDE